MHARRLSHGKSCGNKNHAHVATNDWAKSEGTITRLHTWLPIWPSLHNVNTGVKKRPDSLLNFLKEYKILKNVYLNIQFHKNSNSITFCHQKTLFKEVVGNIFTTAGQSYDFCCGPHPELYSKGTHNVHPYNFFLWGPGGLHDNCIQLADCRLPTTALKFLANQNPNFST